MILAGLAACCVLATVLRRLTRRPVEPVEAPEEPPSDDVGADLFRSLVDYSSDIVTVINSDGVIVYQSLSASELLYQEPGSAEGKAVETIVDMEDRSALLGLLQPDRLSRLSVVAIELRLLRPDGSSCLTETTITNQLANPAVRGLVLTSRDISERKDLEEQLRLRAFYDSLTGLANRALLRDRLEHAVLRIRRHGGGICLMFIDLDGFKLINDTLGHDVGDRLLGQVAHRLVENVRTTDTVARIGGDEFAILLEDPDDVRNAASIASRILACLQTPVFVDGMALRVTGSIGIDSTGGTHASSAEELLRDADLAMYRAKALGKNQVVSYDPTMREAALSRVRLEKELRRAIDRNELVLHYQPVVSLVSGDLTGVEALVRWAHPTRGLIPPSEFVPVAEESGLIVELGRWALARASEEMAGMTQRTGRDDVWVAVNVATRQLLQPGLVQSVRAALNRSGLPPDRLVLEITEGALLNDPRTCASLLHQLRSLGVRLAIDDFGTGYSSLSRLRSFPVDKLKIDRSFIQEIHHAADRAPIVAAVMAMAHSLGLTAVAEGVETAEQLACLQSHGCEEVQGYGLSRPIPANQVEKILAREESLLAELGVALRPVSKESSLATLVREAADAGGARPDLTRLLLGELARELGSGATFLATQDGHGEVVTLSAPLSIDIREGTTFDAGEVNTFRVLLGADVPAALAERGVQALTLVPVLGQDTPRVLGVADRTPTPMPSHRLVLVELLTRLLAEGATAEPAFEMAAS